MLASCVVGRLERPDQLADTRLDAVVVGPLTLPLADSLISLSR